MQAPGPGRRQTSLWATRGALAALRIPAFRAYAVSRAASSMASTLLQAVIAWQVYAISGSALDLGGIGLMRFISALLTSLLGGAVVDTYDRRVVLILSQLVMLVATVAMLAAIALNSVTLTLLYGLVFVAGAAGAFESPARQALLAVVVPRHLYSRAITANSTIGALASATGPALGGFFLAWQGDGLAYVGHGVMLVAAVAMLLYMPLPDVVRPTRSGVNLEAIREGIAFVWRRPVLLGAMSLDMFAVIFGGARALLPIYATDILQVGAAGYGLLSAAMEVGALVMSIVLLTLPLPRRTGRALLLSVAAFGVTTILFGLSTSLVWALLAYAAVGMADQFSVVMRQNTIQLNTPDELRGRVTAVNSIFVSSSNQLGSVESGLVAALTSAVFAVVSGGVACLAVVAFVAWRVPALRAYQAPRSGRRQREESARAAEQSGGPAVSGE